MITNIKKIEGLLIETDGGTFIAIPEYANASVYKIYKAAHVR